MLNKTNILEVLFTMLKLWLTFYLFFLHNIFQKQNDPLIKFSPFNQKVQGSIFFSNFLS